MDILYHGHMGMTGAQEGQEMAVDTLQFGIPDSCAPPCGC